MEIRTGAPITLAKAQKEKELGRLNRSPILTDKNSFNPYVAAKTFHRRMSLLQVLFGKAWNMVYIMTG